MLKYIVLLDYYLHSIEKSNVDHPMYFGVSEAMRSPTHKVRSHKASFFEVQNFI